MTTINLPELPPTSWAWTETEKRVIAAYATQAVEQALASQWQPISTAPRSGLILLAVTDGNEQRVFVSEWSTDLADGYWLITVGWNGWTKLHGSWVPTNWQTLPAPPAIASQGEK